MLSLSILDVKFNLKLLNYISYLGLTEMWKEVEGWIEL